MGADQRIGDRVLADQVDRAVVHAHPRGTRGGQAARRGAGRHADAVCRDQFVRPQHEGDACAQRLPERGVHAHRAELERPGRCPDAERRERRVEAGVHVRVGAVVLVVAAGGLEEAEQRVLDVRVVQLPAADEQLEVLRVEAGGPRLTIDLVDPDVDPEDFAELLLQVLSRRDAFRRVDDDAKLREALAAGVAGFFEGRLRGRRVEPDDVVEGFVALVAGDALDDPVGRGLVRTVEHGFVQRFAVDRTREREPHVEVGEDFVLHLHLERGDAPRRDVEQLRFRRAGDIHRVDARDLQLVVLVATERCRQVVEEADRDLLERGLLA